MNTATGLTRLEMFAISVFGAAFLAVIMLSDTTLGTIGRLGVFIAAAACLTYAGRQYSAITSILLPMQPKVDSTDLKTARRVIFVLVTSGTRIEKQDPIVRHLESIIRETRSSLEAGIAMKLRDALIKTGEIKPEQAKDAYKILLTIYFPL